MLSQSCHTFWELVAVGAEDTFEAGQWPGALTWHLGDQCQRDL
jgi:hypothetical protein